MHAYYQNLKQYHRLVNNLIKENTKRAHFQACIWKAALDEEPPKLDPLKFGWVKDDSSKSLSAISLPMCISSASLLSVLQMWWV